MSSTGKGCVAIAIIGFAALMYFLIFVVKPGGDAKSPYRGTVTNYMDNPPEMPRVIQVGQGLGGS